MTDNPPQSDNQTLEPYKAISQATRNRIFTAPLPNPIAKNVEAIAILQNREVQNLPWHQRLLEKVAHFFDKPLFLYCLLMGLTFWILGGFLSKTGVLPFSWPMFSWSGQGLDAASLLISTGVLVRQSRQESLAEQRSQLTLQLNLLSEQKIAKIIRLLEDLRTDLPDVPNHHDPEAQIMQEAADPIQVIDALQENLERELLSNPPSKVPNHKAVRVPNQSCALDS
ncbi:MAG: DUF1003 domain-containing protein [Thermosynechococcaceae cyanobacterium]